MLPVWSYSRIVRIFSGNHKAAIRHYRMVARAGDDELMQELMRYFRTSGSVMISEDDLATTLCAQKAFNDKRKTEPREYAKRHRAFEEKMV